MMKSLSFVSLYRSASRHPLYTGLNIVGLAAGIAVFIVLSLYVRFATSFERWLPHYDQVFVVQTEWKRADGPFVGTFSYTMGGLLDQLKQDFPGLKGTRILGGKDGGSVVRNGVAVFEDVAQVDGDFLDVLNIPLVAGDRTRALQDPASVVISEEMSRKYFPGVDPLGRMLTVATGESRNYRVTGVFEDLPRATDLRLSILVRLPANDSPWWNLWGSTAVRTYLRLPDRAAVAALEQRLPAFVDRRGAKDLGGRASDKMGLPLLPLAELRFESEGQETNGRRTTVVTLGIVGFLTLLIAILNYVNLASARAGLRAREVAMRKVLGADRASLVRQFLGEAILMVGVAALIGLAIAQAGLPLVNAAGGLSLAMPYLVVLPALILLAVVVGTAAGFYPALMLSGFPASSVLASARAPGGGRAGSRARATLVVFQFALATVFLIATAVMVAQARHVRNADLGFQREGLIVAPWVGYVDVPKRTALIEALRQTPGVVAVATSSTSVGGDGPDNADNLAVPGRPGAGSSVRRINVGSDFFRLYQPRLLAGRILGPTYRTDDVTGLSATDPRNIVINRRAVTALGFRSPTDAVGKTVGDAPRLTIVGVIDELRFFSPRSPSEPTYYLYNDGIVPYPVATIRFVGDPRAAMDAVGATWRRVAPEAPLKAFTGERLLQNFYEDDDRAMRLFAIGAAIAVLIGCVGLWGLASFTAQRRIKEIGIRKSLGASSADVVLLLIGQFLRPVVIGSVIAWPLAYWAMRTWLTGFEDAIALSPMYFVGASLVASLVALATVVSQALRASRATPAWALHHE